MGRSIMDHLLFLLIFVVFPITLVIAVIRGRRWKRANPDKQSFTWGYFFCYQNLIGSALMVLVFVSCIIIVTALGPENFSEEIFDVFEYKPDNMQRESTQTAVILFYTAMTLITGYSSALFILSCKGLSRNRRCLVLLTILSFNVPIFIINYIYLRNRWDELAPQPKDNSLEQNTPIEGKPHEHDNYDDCQIDTVTRY